MRFWRNVWGWRSPDPRQEEAEVKALCTPLLRLHRVATVVVFVAVVGLAATASAGNFAALVINGANGEPIYGVSADEPRYPASLTKMMTLYLTFEALDSGRIRLTDRMPVSAYAASRPPSKLGLDPGDSLSVEQAILALVTKSANDAAAVLAEHLGGSESAFAERMTARARALGMDNTTFRNASGLPDPAQVTTARDMATLGYALLHRFPHYYPYFSTTSFYYGGAVHPNHNRMLGTYAGVDGIKTGFINSSGFNLVASAKRDGQRLIGVVFGARSSAERARMMTALLDGGFDALQSGTFVEAPLLRTVAVTRSGPLPAAGAGASSVGEDAPATWSVRVGAPHRTVADAQRAGGRIAANAPSSLAGSADVVSVQSGKKSRGYAVQWSGLDRGDAASACRAFSARGLSCKVLRGAAGTAVASATAVTPATRLASIGTAKVSTAAARATRTRGGERVVVRTAAPPTVTTVAKRPAAKAVTPTSNQAIASFISPGLPSGKAASSLASIGATKGGKATAPPTSTRNEPSPRGGKADFAKQVSNAAAKAVPAKGATAGKSADKQQTLKACAKAAAKSPSCRAAAGAG
jgi:D-alanyl-D-alanine carboxypeptidase